MFNIGKFNTQKFNSGAVGILATTPYPLCIAIGYGTEYGISVSYATEYGVDILFGGCS